MRLTSGSFGEISNADLNCQLSHSQNEEMEDTDVRCLIARAGFGG